MEETKGPGSSIYVGALVTWSEQQVAWQGKQRAQVLKPPGDRRQMMQYVSNDAVGVVVSKCPNDVIRAAGRTWCVVFEGDVYAIEQTRIKRVSYSWKEKAVSRSD